MAKKAPVDDAAITSAPKNVEDAAKVILAWIESFPYGGLHDSNLTFVRKTLTPFITGAEIPEPTNLDL